MHIIDRQKREDPGWGKLAAESGEMMKMEEQSVFGGIDSGRHILMIDRQGRRREVNVKGREGEEKNQEEKKEQQRQQQNNTKKQNKQKQRVSCPTVGLFCFYALRCFVEWEFRGG